MGTRSHWELEAREFFKSKLRKKVKKISMTLENLTVAKKIQWLLNKPGPKSLKEADCF